MWLGETSRRTWLCRLLPSALHSLDRHSHIVLNNFYKCMTNFLDNRFSSSLSWAVVDTRNLFSSNQNKYCFYNDWCNAILSWERTLQAAITNLHTFSPLTRPRKHLADIVFTCCTLLIKYLKFAFCAAYQDYKWSPIIGNLLTAVTGRMHATMCPRGSMCNCIISFRFNCRSIVGNTHLWKSEKWHTKSHKRLIFQ